MNSITKVSKYRDRTGSEVTTTDGKEPPPPGPCTFCGAVVPWAMLSTYGARCLRCYEAYCLKGVKGATPGFLDGRRDTPAQALIRKGLRADRPLLGEVT